MSDIDYTALRAYYRRHNRASKPILAVHMRALVCTQCASHLEAHDPQSGACPVGGTWFQLRQDTAKAVRLLMEKLP